MAPPNALVDPESTFSEFSLFVCFTRAQSHDCIWMVFLDLSIYSFLGDRDAGRHLEVIIGLSPCN